MLSAMVLAAMGGTEAEVVDEAMRSPIPRGVLRAYQNMNTMIHRPRGQVQPGRLMSAKKARRLRRSGR